MLDPDATHQALKRLFRRRPAVDLEALCAVLGTQSRMSVFRRLSSMGYYSSYSHTGRYYTLQEIPRFDADGLWQHEGIGFSRHGSLKETLEYLVLHADAGWTHQELYDRLRVRVQNPLLQLVRGQRIGREPVGREYVYVSVDPERAQVQLARRRQLAEETASEVTDIPLPVVVEVLLTVIQSGRGQADAARVVQRLAARGLEIPARQVEAVLHRYDLKKTPRSRSRRSRR